MVLGKTKENDVNQIIEALKEIQNSEFISKSEIFYDSFESLIQRLSDQSFRIAVVGEFSSGKSTFLNALIGEDLLKHGAQETTATVTEIYNDPNCGNQPLMIALASLLWDKKDRVNIELIWEIKAIINRCIQGGNYRRAWRYIVAGKSIIERIERNESSIIKSTTGLILNDGKKVFAK